MAADDKKPAEQKRPEPLGADREDSVYGKPPGAGDWRRITRLSLLGILVAFTVLFFLGNLNSVEVSLVVTTVNVPLVWVLLGTFLLGAAVMYLLLYLRKRAGRKARAAEK
jgi:uncharacterized integral membrane protein